MDIKFSDERILTHGDIKKLVQYDDKKMATALSLWQRFLDLFRGSTKKSVIDSLYENINEHPETKLGCNIYYRLYNFEKLKSLALPAYRGLFKVSVQSLGQKINQYTLSIGNVDIYNFETPNNWALLSNETFDGFFLVTQYRDILIKHKESHHDVFKERCHDVKITKGFNADTFLEYSCFFLEEEKEVKLKLLEYGLSDQRVMEFYVKEMKGEIERRGKEGKMKIEDCDNLIDNIDYTLTTLYASLSYLEGNKNLN